MPLQPGDKIERYVIESLLGAGGMGEVYKAYDTRLKRSIALKILRADDAPADPNAKTSAPMSEPSARMLREAQLAASLDHPNVVAVFDVGLIESVPDLHGTTYLAMELIRGEPLRKSIGDASIKMRTRVRWLEEMARALGAAHAAGLVHRDVKPENVMIREDGLVKVLDFGVAKRTPNAFVDPTSSTTEGLAMPTMTKEGAVVGTPFYMAPEQLRAEPLDGRADQFAWGVVAYELLTGKSLWSVEGGGFSLVAQILQAPPPDASSLGDVPERVAQAVVRALAKNAADRFPTMTALVEAMSGKADGDTDAKIPVRPSSPDVAELARSSAGPSTKRSNVVVDAPPHAEPAPASSARAEEVATKRSKPPPPRSPTKRARAIAIAAGAGAVVAAAALATRARSPAPRPEVDGGGRAIAVASGGCTSNRACVEAHGGEAWVCRKADGACVAIASPDCTPRFEARDLAHDDTVWIGAMFPLHGPRAEAFGQMNANGVELARREIADATRSLADESSPQHVRRVAVVSCNDDGDPTRAARHLVDDVGVPAIVGFKSGDELVDLAVPVLLPRETMAIASLTGSPAIMKVPQPASLPHMVWRTTVGLEAVAAPVAAFAASLADGAKRGSEPARVAFVRGKHASFDDFAQGFFQRLSFNGKSALENGRDYDEITVEDAPSPERVATVADRIDALAPTVIVTLVRSEDIALYVRAIDQGWRAARHPRPFYLAADESTAVLDAFVGTSAERRHRVFAVASVSETEENARFVFRYNAAFQPAVTRTVNPSTSYDAFYVAAFATFAVDASHATGADMARAMRRLDGPGARVDVGPGGVLDAVGALAKGATIALHGTATSLSFDVATGEPLADFALLCPYVDAKGQANGDLESGLVYRSANAATTGVARCP